MCRGPGYDEWKDYFYITEGKIILQTWCKGLKHVALSQGGWQVMLFIPRDTSFPDNVWKTWEEICRLFLARKDSTHSHGVLPPMGGFRSCPRMAKAWIWSQEKWFWVISLALKSLFTLGEFLNPSAPWCTILYRRNKGVFSFKIELRIKWNNTCTCFYQFKSQYKMVLMIVHKTREWVNNSCKFEKYHIISKL